jgi:hypothetical protein
MERDPALHREARECVREQGGRETADPVAGEGEGDLGVRPADKVDGCSRKRLVHRHGRGAVAGDTGTVAQRIAERVAERGENVLDGVVLVDVEVARREQPVPSRSSTIRSAVSELVRETSAFLPGGGPAVAPSASSRTSFSGGRRNEIRIPSGKARTTSPATSSRSASGSSVRTQTKLA